MAFGFKIKVGVDSSAAERGLATVGRSAERINRRLGRLSVNAAKFAVGMGAVAAAGVAIASVGIFKDASKKAAEFESLSTSLEHMLGSADAAKDRLAALQEFSIRTPFEPTELIEASRFLQKMGGDTLAVGKGLQFIGDATSSVNGNLEVVANHIGRIFNALTEGGELAESTGELQKMGLVTGRVRSDWLRFGQELRKGTAPLLGTAQALKFIQDGFGNVEGAMEKLSQTFTGKISTMKGNVDILKIALGQGINDGLLVGIDAVNEKLPTFQDSARGLGSKIGFAISEGLRGNMEPIEATATFIFQRVAEIGTAVIGGAVSNFVTQDPFFSAALRLGSPMIKPKAVADTTGRSFNPNPGPLSTESASSLTRGAFGSDETREILKRMDKRMEREALKEDLRAGRRDIVGGQLTELKYSR